jgi:outer membrane biogenesis lipoprotein LolB
MADNRVLNYVVLASSVLLMTACASASPGALDEKYFQEEARNYLKFEKEGQVVYCQNQRETSSLIPYKRCISEASLRQRVANYRVSRNAVQRGGPQYVATVPGG